MDTEDTDDDPITSLLERFEEMQSLFKQSGKIWTPWIAKVSEDGKVRYLLSVESIINYLKGGMLEILETGGMELNRSVFEDIPGVGRVAKITPFPNRLQKPEAETNMQSNYFIANLFPEDPDFEEALRAEREARLKEKRESDRKRREARKKAKAQCDEKAKQLRAQYGDDIFVDYDLEEGKVRWGWKLF